MTHFPELFEALGQHFESNEVRKRKQGGHELAYITARVAMNRLDTILGPENWWDEYLPGQHSVICKLTVRLPDGSTLTKQDAGGYAGMADQGDDDKSGFSDAFKRAAVKFGVGRYLYRDGVPTFPRQVTKESIPAQLALPDSAPAVQPAISTPADLHEWLRGQKDSPLDPGPGLARWATQRRYPDKMSAWSAAQVRAGFGEAQRLVLAARSALEAHEPVS